MTKFSTDGLEIQECPHTLLQAGHGKALNPDACIYCGKDDFNFLVLSEEFDWLIHLCCIVKAYEEASSDDRAEVDILMEEFEIHEGN